MAVEIDGITAEVYGKTIVILVAEKRCFLVRVLDRQDLTALA
ncbi:MAG: hypothetical protein AAFQ14_18670 [Cyanobacteria bacterium J06621_12]